MADKVKVALRDHHTVRNFAIVGVTIALVLGLPLAVWLDMSRLSETNLRRQALDFSKVVGLARDFYSRKVVARSLSGMELYIDLDAADGAEVDRLIEEVSALRAKPA